MKTRVCDIRSNPFRDMTRYPYHPDKIAQLRESLRMTGFWGNLIARPTPEGPELAYGHHRLQALREEYPPEHEIDLIERDLSDDDMLKIMARENMTEWGTSAAIEMETVRAVVEAYGSGRIELTLPPADSPRSRLRYAPSFCQASGTPDVLQSPGERPYTAQAVAEYVGWVNAAGEARQKAYDVLTALELIEEGILGDDDYRALSTTQAQAVTQQARAQRDQARERARKQDADAQQAEDEAQRATAAREQARLAREEERRREAEAQAAHDEQMSQAARQRAQEAQEAYNRAQAEQQAASQRAQRSRALAQQERSQGHQAAGEIGRHVSTQIRGGASVREATRSAQENHPAPPQHPLDMAARRTAQVLTRLFSDSDVRRLLDQITQGEGSISADACSELSRALKTVSASALAWHDTLNPPGGVIMPTSLTITTPPGLEVTSVS